MDENVQVLSVLNVEKGEITNDYFSELHWSQQSQVAQR